MADVHEVHEANDKSKFHRHCTCILPVWRIDFIIIATKVGSVTHGTQIR